MARSKSSKTWLDEHFKDNYVISSKEDGYRSRASYKLLELDAKDRLFHSGMTVVDLGAAPGGWSQVAVEKVGHKGVVFASDILDMDAIAGVSFIKGDFTDDAVLDALLAEMDNQGADIVISDMAPNMSGMREIDQPQSMHLVELALDMARQVLKPKGVFVTKIFQGEGFDDFVKECRSAFTKVAIRKPDASRSRSREVYLIAKGFKA